MNHCGSLFTLADVETASGLDLFPHAPDWPTAARDHGPVAANERRPAADECAKPRTGPRLLTIRSFGQLDGEAAYSNKKVSLSARFRTGDGLLDVAAAVDPCGSSRAAARDGGRRTGSEAGSVRLRGHVIRPVAAPRLGPPTCLRGTGLKKPVSDDRKYPSGRRQPLRRGVRRVTRRAAAKRRTRASGLTRRTPWRSRRLRPRPPSGVVRFTRRRARHRRWSGTAGRVPR